MEFTNTLLTSISRTSHMESRAITPENFTGEKGKGGMATEGTGSEFARELGAGWKISPSIFIPAGETVEIANIEGPGIIKHIWMTDNSGANRKLIIRIYWEGSDTPSVEAPVGDFFACADYNSSFDQVNSLPVCVNPRKGFNCFWDMPFFKNCRITIENTFYEQVTLYYQIDYQIGKIPENSCYFHAQFRRVNPLPYKEVYTLLDNVSGNGQYVGTYMFWQVNSNRWWGEGEVKIYLDGDTDYPTICGTGTEDYFLGSYNFDVKGEYREFSTPFAGMPKVIRPDGLYSANQRFSLYRWHIADPIYFKKDIKITVQALGWRDNRRYLPLKDDISSVAFWYQDSICKTFPEFPSTDELEMN